MLKKLNLALEEEQMIEEAGELEVSDADSELLEINDSTDELTEELTDIEELTNDLDEAPEDIEVLDQIEADLGGGEAEETEVVDVEETETETEGGEKAGEEVEEKTETISAISAESMTTTLKIIQARWGVNTSRLQTALATENFSSNLPATTRSRNEVMALNETKETKTSIMEGLKKALIAAWEWLKEFYRKHVTQVGRIEKAAKSLKAKLNKLEGEVESAGKKYMSAKLAKSLAYSGKVKEVNFGVIADAQKAAMGLDDVSMTVLKHIADIAKTGDVGSLDMSVITDKLEKLNSKLPGGSNLIAEGEGVDTKFVFDKAEMDEKAPTTIPTKDEAVKACDLVLAYVEKIYRLKDWFDKESKKVTEDLSKKLTKDFADKSGVEVKDLKALTNINKQTVKLLNMTTKVLTTGASVTGEYAALAFKKVKGDGTDAAESDSKELAVVN